MSAWRVVLGPGIESLFALGVAAPCDLFSATGEIVELGLGGETLRFALPGGGAAHLRRYTTAPLRALLAARLTAPRSESLAEREWNLLCHLRAHGVGTPELLAVGARGRGPVARCSFLVLREPERMLRFDRWLALEVGAEIRARTLGALDAALAALWRAKVRLPALRASDVWLSAEEATGEDGGEADCAALAIGDLRAERALGRLRRNRAPSVVISSAEGGSIAAARRGDSAAALRARLGLLAE